jgi:hypothetical protein
VVLLQVEKEEPFMSLWAQETLAMEGYYTCHQEIQLLHRQLEVNYPSLLELDS